jgi:hypothetical protein
VPDSSLALEILEMQGASFDHFFCVLMAGLEARNRSALPGVASKHLHSVTRFARAAPRVRTPALTSTRAVLDGRWHPMQRVIAVVCTL